jgi:hypothetical protein
MKTCSVCQKEIPQTFTYCGPSCKQAAKLARMTPAKLAAYREHKCAVNQVYRDKKKSIARKEKEALAGWNKKAKPIIDRTKSAQPRKMIDKKTISKRARDDAHLDRVILQIYDKAKQRGDMAECQTIEGRNRHLFGSAL